jgi:hypothetical protein
VSILLAMWHSKVLAFTVSINYLDFNVVLRMMSGGSSNL